MSKKNRQYLMILQFIAYELHTIAFFNQFWFPFWFFVSCSISFMLGVSIYVSILFSIWTKGFSIPQGFSSPFYTLGRVGIEWKSDKIIIIQSVSFSHHQLVISKAPTPPKNLPTPISMLHLWKLTAQPMPSTGLHNGLK